MVAGTIVETRDRTWSPVLERLSAPALDCVQTGLAALADLHHGPGTHLWLGARLGFAPSTAPDRPPTMEAPVDQRLAEARDLVGLRVAERRDGLDGPALRKFAAEAGTLYVVADAFTMLWTPYRGQRHMDHSFLLVPGDDRHTVVDPYHNETQWGTARPGVWRLTESDLDTAVGAACSAMVIVPDQRPELNPAAVLAANARAMTDAESAIDRYLAQVRAGLDREEGVEALVLDVWLLGRSRLLHTAWLETVPEVPPLHLEVAQEQSWDWLRLASQSYLGLRRVQRGAELPSSVMEQFEELFAGDVEIASRLSAALADVAVVPQEIRDVVVEVVRSTLGLDDGGEQSFRSLSNFNSFRLVDIIEQVETRLGVDLDGDDLTVDALRDVETLARLFARAARRAGG
ncbi:MAG TPA: hypothetical protein VIC62_23445 [Nakamurella sp.]